MRITFVLPTVSLSGGIRVVAIYARALAARGHAVTLVSPPPREPPFRSRLGSLLRGGGWPSRPLPLKSHLDGLDLDHRVLETWRPIVGSDVPDADVVIATWWETAEWVNALGPEKGAKVYFIQGHEVFPHLPVLRCRATYRFPMHKIVVARWLRDVMSDQYADDAVDLVPNSIDRSQFFASPREKQAVPTVGFLYAPAEIKGLDVLLAAIGILRQRFPPLRLICFGHQPPIGALPLPAKTEFSFSPPQDQIRNLYSRCDAWITASRSEGFNLPAMEAMACRTPVVSTRTGWPAEAIVTGENGVLVEVDDVAALADAVSKVLLLSDADWRAMSSRAYATVGSCSWESSVLQFEAALENARRRAALGEIGGGAGFETAAHA